MVDFFKYFQQKREKSYHLKNAKYHNKCLVKVLILNVNQSNH